MQKKNKERREGKVKWTDGSHYAIITTYAYRKQLNQ